MKFSNSLKFNAVPDWWDEYIAYSALKKKIYELSVQFDLEPAAGQHQPYERARLLESGTTSANDIFTPLLDRELDKIAAFYTTQEKEMLDELEELRALVERTEEEGLDATPYYDDDDDDDEDDDEDETQRSQSYARDPSHGRETSYGRESSSRRRRKASLDAGHLTDRSDMGRRSSVGSEDYDIEASARRRRSVDGETSPTSPLKPIANMFRFGSLRGPEEPETIWTARTDFATDTRMLFKRRITTLYILATSLRSYVELNQTGFRKVLKKYEKVTMNDLKDFYIHTRVEKAYPFTTATKDRLHQAINDILALYARCVTRGSVSMASKQLKIHQREHIVWERDTVWRQMIGRERRGESDGQVKALGGTIDSKEEPILSVPTPVGRFSITNKGVSLLVAIAVFVLCINFPIVQGEAANNCFAILCFSTILWATEAIPLFVTSIMVPLLVVMMRVVLVEKDGKGHKEAVRLPPKEATEFVFSIMFSPTIMLLIGGFTIASALSKSNIDRILITRVLSLAGTRPSVVLLAFMMVSCFASMWISNVAAPTLCFTLIRPMLAQLPPGSRFAPCVILGIALAANIGGQSSPISSPQNLIAMNDMEPKLDWTGWFAVSIPVSGISILLIWLLLLANYNPGKTIDGETLTIKPIRPPRERFSAKQYYVSFVCVLTIALWCFEHKLEGVVGSMGIIAIIPILAFFGTGVLKKADFDQFLWTVVFLAMGGIALGKAVAASGLLHEMDKLIRSLIEGLPAYSVVLALCVIVLIVSTFISHTIAAVLLVPIAKEVGANLTDGSPRLMIFITALVSSTGMALPVSGFPNQTAASQEDEMGNLYLTTGDFIKNGVPASVMSAAVVGTVGYGMMWLTGLASSGPSIPA
ncbi:low-affinity phosphate transporter [Tulasnella sp. 403]|nr:low-affinity phosphate transporter [Tulasnella sp. 403]